MLISRVPSTVPCLATPAVSFCKERESETKIIVNLEMTNHANNFQKNCFVPECVFLSKKRRTTMPRVRNLVSLEFRLTLTKAGAQAQKSEHVNCVTCLHITCNCTTCL